MRGGRDEFVTACVNNPTPKLEWYGRKIRLFTVVASRRRGVGGHEGGEEQENDDSWQHGLVGWSQSGVVVGLGNVP